MTPSEQRDRQAEQAEALRAAVAGPGAGPVTIRFDAVEVDRAELERLHRWEDIAQKLMIETLALREELDELRWQTERV